MYSLVSTRVLLCYITFLCARTHIHITITCEKLQIFILWSHIVCIKQMDHSTESVLFLHVLVYACERICVHLPSVCNPAIKTRHVALWCEQKLSRASVACQIAVCMYVWLYVCYYGCMLRVTMWLSLWGMWDGGMWDGGLAPICMHVCVYVCTAAWRKSQSWRASVACKILIQHSHACKKICMCIDVRCESWHGRVCVACDIQV
jgi:hypothetical protein